MLNTSQFLVDLINAIAILLDNEFFKPISLAFVMFLCITMFFTIFRRK